MTLPPVFPLTGIAMTGVFRVSGVSDPGGTLGRVGGTPPCCGIGRSDRHREQRRADRKLRAFLTEPGRHHPSVRAGDLHHRLGRLDLDDRLVDDDGVADVDQPAHDLGLGEPLPEVRQLELEHMGHQLSASH